MMIIIIKLKRLLNYLRFIVGPLPSGLQLVFFPPFRRVLGRLMGLSGRSRVNPYLRLHPKDASKAAPQPPSWRGVQGCWFVFMPRGASCYALIPPAVDLGLSSAIKGWDPGEAVGKQGSQKQQAAVPRFVTVGRIWEIYRIKPHLFLLRKPRPQEQNIDLITHPMGLSVILWLSCSPSSALSAVWTLGFAGMRVRFQILKPKQRGVFLEISK